MKNLATLVITLCAVLGLSSVASASPCTATLCRDTRIDRLFATAGGDVLVSPIDGGQSNLNCTANSGQYLTLPQAHPNYDAIFKMLLAAKVARAPIWVRIVDNTPNCEIAYLVLEN